MTYLWQFLVAAFFAWFAYACMPIPGGGYRGVQWFWRAVAWTVSRKPVFEYLRRCAMRTPYSEIPGYMKRYWLFNAYDKVNGEEVTPIKWLPSIRVHHILRRDGDRHMHDHPWDARTMVMSGHYIERRPGLEGTFLIRKRGYTGPIGFGEYHTIVNVSEGGVWTLFFTWGWMGVWGFLVDGKKAPWHEYMAMYPDKPWAADDKASQA